MVKAVPVHVATERLDPRELRRAVWLVVACEVDSLASPRQYHTRVAHVCRHNVTRPRALGWRWVVVVVVVQEV